MDWNFGHAALAVGPGIGALVFGVCYWIWSDRKRKLMALILVISGSACIVSGPIGQWINGITTTVDAWITGLIAGLAGAAVITGLTALVLIIWLTICIANKKITTATIAVGVVAPIAVAMIPGQAGYWLTTGLGWVAWLVTWPFAWLLGWI